MFIPPVHSLENLGIIATERIPIDASAVTVVLHRWRKTTRPTLHIGSLPLFPRFELLYVTELAFCTAIYPRIRLLSHEHLKPQNRIGIEHYVDEGVKLSVQATDTITPSPCAVRR